MQWPFNSALEIKLTVTMCPSRMPLRPSRKRRWGPLLLLVPAAGLLLGLIGINVFLATLPSTRDAEARVDDILRHSGARDGGSPPPLYIGRATVAIEDRRFYNHHGIDTMGILRAGWAFVSGQPLQGGDTITEQLAKVLYVGDDHSFRRKLTAMGLAITLEQHYSKSQILEMYLNAIYYGDGQWGAEQASEAYFGKPPDELDWAEASLLAGLPQAPSAYDPTRHFDLARQRQRQVLAALVSTGALTTARAAAAYDELSSLGQ